MSVASKETMKMMETGGDQLVRENFNHELEEWLKNYDPKKQFTRAEVVKTREMMPEGSWLGKIGWWAEYEDEVRKAKVMKWPEMLVVGGRKAEWIIERSLWSSVIEGNNLELARQAFQALELTQKMMEVVKEKKWGRNQQQVEWFMGELKDLKEALDTNKLEKLNVTRRLVVSEG